MSLPDPVTRKEMYLNKAATGSGSIPPEPVTREEMYLAEIANGGGSGGASEPLVVTLVPGSQDNPFGGTYVGATADELRTAFQSGRKIFAKLGDKYFTPSILNENRLCFYFTYESGSVVLFINSRLNVASGQNTYNSSLYTGLTGE